jgi:hypothetical protein
MDGQGWFWGQRYFFMISFRSFASSLASAPSGDVERPNMFSFTPHYLRIDDFTF